MTLTNIVCSTGDLTLCWREPAEDDDGTERSQVNADRSAPGAPTRLLCSASVKIPPSRTPLTITFELAALDSIYALGNLPQAVP